LVLRERTWITRRISSDDWIEFILGRLRDQIDAILLEGLEFTLWALIGDSSTASDALKTLQDVFFVNAKKAQKL
jgi:hypothetical protein